MKYFRIIFIIFLLSISIISCEKEEVVKFENGIIKNLGEPASDGCGWVIEITSINYRPQNLSESLKVDNLEVELKYTKLESESPCGFSQPIKEIFIEEIREK